ncbi:hypothetical protein [Aeromonas hydrophila]|uniref:AbiU2 domain-containing protein n=1 Tax=Aeromonas hydrophila TaxID=644 RepID=UPI001A90057A|nr:hypothetical protein [Aeromonas hydrophila]MBQ4664874.1 hypothetical protein [Aeromonas hydrophila]MBQ4713059.1 hypothetical protein [Aeromonas hydrophila]MBW3825201.1 hypothetical protein [Aeromonas hydrophila]MBW5270691.1 hypothetical protein [Aeromonas hydrophila]QSR49998.1 hypothetical protein GO458_01100 [Aeromonas hydrophila]
MTDLDRFIIELDRVKTLVHFYDELYGSDETINVLNKLSPQGIQIIQRSLHDDILMSIARLLYDGQCYKYKKIKYEYFSLCNLVNSYAHLLDDELNIHRDVIREIKESINIEDYRNLVLAHADKSVYVGRETHPKHGLSSATLIELLTETRQLAFGIRYKLMLQNGENTLPVSDGRVYRNGIGANMIRKLKALTEKSEQK